MCVVLRLPFVLVLPRSRCLVLREHACDWSDSSDAVPFVFVWGPRRRLLEDLEEVQTDKVSMEYLLREKLERLVQSEIEARVARMHQVDRAFL